MACPQYFIGFCAIIFLNVVGVVPVSAQNADKSLRKGLTFTAENSSDGHESANTASASCGKTESSDPLCNPYEGDTLCKTALPLLCILDIDAAVPTTLNNSKFWSGGVLAKSSPWRGADISNIQDANRICSDSFGEKWRMASFHDGGGWGIEGYGVLASRHISAKPDKMWVDIKDQPAGTCWTR